MFNFHFPHAKGFTLIEIVLTVSIMGILIGIATLSLLKVKQRTSLDVEINTILTDIRAQQAKSMIGNVVNDLQFSYPYGVHFNQNDYVLFHNSAYSANDSNNFVISLSSENIQVVNPNTDLIFSKGSGDLPSAVTITFKEKQSGEQKTLQFNSYGAVTAEN